MPRLLASTPTWFEVCSRRSRLRSATRLLASATAPVLDLDGAITHRDGTEGIADTPIAVGNAGDELPRKRHRDDDDADPAYRLFLDHLKVDGKSYLLEMEAGDAGTPLLLKYEEDYVFCNATPPPSDLSCGRGSSKTKYYKAKKKDANKWISSLDSRELVYNDGDCEMDDSMVDEDYLVFLNNVREYNGSMILELDNGIIIRYEEEEEQEESADSKTEDLVNKVQEVRIKIEDFEEESYQANTQMALQPYSGSLELSNYSTCRDDVCFIETVGYKVPSLYGHGLRIILEKPFDQSEYDRLLSMATIRTPKRKLKHLRNMSKAYATHELGRSYLDYFPQLAERIKHSDHHDGLLLLRGFFYWLENVVHDGAFKPWECASSSYETLPSSGCNLMLPLQIEMNEN